MLDIASGLLGLGMELAPPHDHLRNEFGAPADRTRWGSCVSELRDAWGDPHHLTTTLYR
jgi:hypothetical protein